LFSFAILKEEKIAQKDRWQAHLHKTNLSLIVQN
jgi:hypothetical protein